MFDQQSGGALPPQQPPAQPSMVPPNLPISSAPAPAAQQPVEDIFSSSAAGMGAAGAPAGSYQQRPMASSMPISQELERTMIRRPFWRNPAFVIALILLILAGLVVGGWLLYVYVLKNLSTTVLEGLGPSTNTNNDIINGNDDSELVDIPVVTPPIIDDTFGVTNVTTTPDTTITTTAPVIPVDSDSDGLTDAEESQYGTDPNNYDSDSDALTDHSEIRIYKTDPLNSDSDGDGYKDGEEVVNGYDPARPGSARLFVIPPASDTNNSVQ